MLGNTGHNCRSKFPEKLRGDKIQTSSGGWDLDERREYLFQQRENRLRWTGKC